MNHSHPLYPTIMLFNYSIFCGFQQQKYYIVVMLEVNCLVFPKPSFSCRRAIEKNLVLIPKDINGRHYYPCQKANDEIACSDITSCRSTVPTPTSIWRLKTVIKKQQKSSQNSAYVPCVYIKGTYDETKLIIYFHSNAEDLVSSFDFVKSIGKCTGRSVLVVEYPGYSVYKNSKPESSSQKSFGFQWKNQTTSEEIQYDATRVIEYMKQVAGFSLKDISIIGRSIGSGPAVYIASIYHVGCLVLLSPFLSLCSAVKDLYGQLCARLITERFNNKQRIKLIQSPCLLIHGLEDTIIPASHSIQLNKQIKSFTKLKLVQKMKHNSFHFQKDFMVFVKDFFKVLEEEWEV